jgi:hypothetical protein
MLPASKKKPYHQLRVYHTIIMEGKIVFPNERSAISGKDEPEVCLCPFFACLKGKIFEIAGNVFHRLVVRVYTGTENIIQQTQGQRFPKHGSEIHT